MQHLGRPVKRHVGQRAFLCRAVEHFTQRIYFIIVFEQFGGGAVAHDRNAQAEPYIIIRAKIVCQRQDALLCDRLTQQQHLRVAQMQFAGQQVAQRLEQFGQIVAGGSEIGG